jgi:hypothetical protein
MVESAGYEAPNCEIFFSLRLFLWVIVTILKHTSLIFLFIKIKEGKMHIARMGKIRISYKF